MTLFIIILFIVVILVILLAFNTNSVPTTPIKQRKTRNDIDKEYYELLRETKELEKENNEWSAEFNKFRSHVALAIGFEKTKELDKAIDEYLIAVSIGENSNRLRINNFSHYIGRLIILYGKTKRFEELEVLLTDITAKHKDYRDCADWQVRLENLKNKKSPKN